MHKKMNRLEEILNGYSRVAVAFSGGIDSTFLLAVAHRVLGDRVAAITISAPNMCIDETHEAIDFCKERGINHKTIELNIFDNKEFVANTKDRCYFCKKDIFAHLIHAAKEWTLGNKSMEQSDEEALKGLVIFDGTNSDDAQDFRPGFKAIEELGVKSPLMEAELTKKEIREQSKAIGLPSWDKPSDACLATRIPCGEEITLEKLSSIEKSERFLKELGFTKLRVRHHGSVARIEVPSEERYKFFDLNMMDRVDIALKQFGFQYVTFDLYGYKLSGSAQEYGKLRL